MSHGAVTFEWNEALKGAGSFQKKVKEPPSGQEQSEYNSWYQPYAEVICHIVKHGLDDEIIINTRGTDTGASKAFLAGEEVIPQEFRVKNLAVSQGFGQADAASCYHGFVTRLDKDGTD